MAAGDILEVTFEWQNVDRGDKYNNVCHFYVQADATGLSNEQALCDALNTEVIDNVLPLLNNKCRFRNTLVQRVYPLPRTAGQQNDNGIGTVGGIAGDALPPACCLVIKKKTAFAGRRFRGRFFCPMLSESDQANGLFGGANVIALTSALDGLLGFLKSTAGDGEYIPVIFPKGGTSASAKIVTNTSRDDVVRQQRRREVGVGS